MIVFLSRHLHVHMLLCHCLIDRRRLRASGLDSCGLWSDVALDLVDVVEP
jgi:hypothetical protein